MSLDRGEHIPPQDFKDKIWPGNLKVLTTWMNIGADVEYGKYAMLGARMGCYSTTVNTNEWTQISDLDKMLDLYENAVVKSFIDQDLKLYGESIRQRIDLPVADLDEYHPCLCQELMGGGLASARAMGWLRGASSKWEFHADVQNPATCHIVTGEQRSSQTGFCCRDS